MPTCNNSYRQIVCTWKHLKESATNRERETGSSVAFDDHVSTGWLVADDLMGIFAIPPCWCPIVPFRRNDRRSCYVYKLWLLRLVPFISTATQFNSLPNQLWKRHVHNYITRRLVSWLAIGKLSYWLTGWFPIPPSVFSVVSSNWCATASKMPH